MHSLNSSARAGGALWITTESSLSVERTASLTNLSTSTGAERMRQALFLSR